MKQFHTLADLIEHYEEQTDIATHEAKKAKSNAEREAHEEVRRISRDTRSFLITLKHRLLP